MNAAELRSLAQLACQAVAGTADRVEEMHLAIARRSFRASGPLGRPAHLLHDAVARTAYSGVRVAGRLGEGAAARLPLPAAGSSLLDSRRGRFALGNHPAVYEQIREWLRLRAAPSGHRAVRSREPRCWRVAPARVMAGKADS